MNIWFECTIKYEAANEVGDIVSKNDRILISTVSYTEVENKISTLRGNDIPEGAVISNIKKATYEDIIFKGESDYWFKGKVIFLEASEKSDKQKKVSRNFLIPANNFVGATEILIEYLRSHYITDNYIHTLSLTNITEVYPV